MTEVPDSLQTLFSATISERDGSYIIDVPRSQVELDAVTPSQTYRVALLQPIETTSTPTEDFAQESKIHGRDSQQEPSDGPPVEEGEIRDVTIEATGDQGDGIAKVNHGYVIIVPGGQPGETLSVEIDTVRSNVAFAQAIEDETGAKRETT